MTAVVRFVAGWRIMGFVAALLAFGPALLRIVAFGLSVWPTIWSLKDEGLDIRLAVKSSHRP
jgi:hypothetical protein